jgi:hypothetical protein
MPRRRSHCCLVLVLASIAISGATARADELSGEFSPEAWQKAVQASAGDWSREALARQFDRAYPLAGRERDQVVGLLGAPGYASETFGIGSGLRYRFDVYRLSAKNDASYAIEYDAQGKGIRGLIDTVGCACPPCGDEAPAAPVDGLRSGLQTQGAAEAGTGIKIARLESLVGRPGKRSVNTNAAGGQAWVHYTEVWRLAGEAHGFLIAEGARVARDWSADAFAEAMVESYSIVTMMPDCLAR